MMELMTIFLELQLVAIKMRENSRELNWMICLYIAALVLILIIKSV